MWTHCVCCHTVDRTMWQIGCITWQPNLHINCVRCHTYALHVASFWLTTSCLLPCYSQYNVANSLYCRRNFFLPQRLCDIWIHCGNFSGSWLDVVSSICCSMCCISARQFHPSTFLPLNKWHLIGVFLGQCVSCHILVFVMWRILWLSIVLSWANMATSTFFVFKCIYHMYTLFTW